MNQASVKTDHNFEFFESNRKTIDNLNGRSEEFIFQNSLENAVPQINNDIVFEFEENNVHDSYFDEPLGGLSEVNLDHFFF